MAMLLARGRQGTSGGFTAEYFQGTDLTDHRVTRTDPQIDGNETLPTTVSPTPGFSMRWSGHWNSGGSHTTGIVVTSPGNSTVQVTVYMNGSLVLSDSFSNGSDDPNGHTFRTAPYGGMDVEIDATYQSYDGSGLVSVDTGTNDLNSANVTPVVVT